MGQIRLDFSLENIDPKDHKLSVYIETDSFVYGIFDKQGIQKAHKQLKIDWKQEDPFASLKNDEVLMAEFYKKVVVIDTPVFVHLPEVDYDSDQLESYFDMKLPHVQYQSDRLTGQDIYVVYPVRKPLRKYLKEVLKPDECVHASTAMANYVYPSQEKAYIANFGNESLQYFSQKEGMLQLYNNYRIRTKEDALYYLELASSNVGMNREKDILYVSGLIDKGSEIFELIRPYYRHIELLHPKLHGLETQDMQQLKHHYFMQYAGALCV